jgi:hypothetical protein
MVAVFSTKPFTTPLDGPTEAMVALLLVHTPNGVAHESVEGTPMHKLVLPVMLAGIGFTDTSLLTKQPRGNI